MQLKRLFYSGATDFPAPGQSGSCQIIWAVITTAVGVDRIVAGTNFPADMSDVDPVRTVESLTHCPPPSAT
jgi:hypothetical protein